MQADGLRTTSFFAAPFAAYCNAHTVHKAAKIEYTLAFIAFHGTWAIARTVWRGKLFRPFLRWRVGGSGGLCCSSDGLKCCWVAATAVPWNEKLAYVEGVCGGLLRGRTLSCNVY